MRPAAGGRALALAAPRALALAAVAVLCASCSPSVGHASRRSQSLARDPPTRAALLRIATAFNADYSAGDDGPVYDRWDYASRKLISRAAYLRRHAECATAPGPAVVEGASPAGNGYWAVRYAISGIQLVDYWHIQHGRWLFDLPRSNPAAVALSRMPFAAYAKAVGCRPAS